MTSRSVAASALVWWCWWAAWGWGTTPARADQFEQLDGPVLARTVRGAEVRVRPALTIVDIGAMPALLRDTRSALVLAKSDQGNPARLLLVPELRKPVGGKGELFPVLVVERLDTFDGSDPSTRLASRRDIVLFDGFELDVDTGQIVPTGQGGDLVFRAGKDGGGRLESLGEAKLFTLNQVPAFDTTRGPQPTPGRSVVATDFAGRYRLFANGQWSGTLDLQVQGRGVIVGQFRSDLHGTSYPVTGQVATDAAQKVRFAIALPRARQEFEGYLWGEGKGAMAGTVSLLDRTFGFFAIREGGRYAPEGRDLGPLTPADTDRPGRLLVEVVGDRIRLETVAATRETLPDLLKARIAQEAEPLPWVLLRTDSNQKYADVIHVARVIEAAGITTIRLELAPPR